jgi:hypothetical protein
VFGSDDELADFLPGGGATLNKVSPSTSESGNINEGRGGLPVATTTATGTAPNGAESSGGASGAAASNPSNIEEDEAKKLARMQRNRENAYLSRQRKKQQMAELQTMCTQLRGQATQLTCLVHRLVAENCLLRHHLGAACQKAGMPVPDVPSAMKPAGVAAGAAAAGTAAAVAPVVGVPAALKQNPALVRPGMVPMVAQQRPPAAPAAVPQQAAAPPAAPSPAPAAAPTTTASGRPVRSKRARVTGAGAAFLTLFSIFLFVGPMAPLTGRHALSSSSSSTPTATAAAGYLAPAGGLSSDHTASQQLLGPITRSHAGARSLLQSASIEDSSTATEERNSLIHQTMDALLQDPRSQQLPALALQRLQDLAPAAVVLDPNESTSTTTLEQNSGGTAGNTVPQSSNPLAANTAFPMLANNFFKAAGLDAPQTCQKVFEFDASTLPHPARSRRSVERFITGAYGFKGRSIGLPDITSSGTATATATSTSSSSPSHTASVFSKSNGGSSSGTPLRLPSPSTLAIQDSEGKSSLVVKALENERRLQELLPDVADVGTPHDGTNEGQDESTDLLPVAVNEPTLVSVLLPSNASQPGDGGLSAVDRVFVVLLHPGERFITYSCGLSRPLLV